MKTHLLFLSIIALMFASCKPQQSTLPEVSVRWEMGSNQPGYKYSNTFHITNMGDTPLGNNWVFYYGQLPAVPQNEEGDPFAVEQICSTHFKLYPTATYENILPGETRAFEFVCRGEVIKEANGPLGGYIVQLDKDGNEVGNPVNVDITVDPFDKPEQWARGGDRSIYPYGDIVYDRNLAIIDDSDVRLHAIFPTVKHVSVKSGYHNRPVAEDAEFTSRIEPKAKPEGYILTITKDHIEIAANDEAGLFYGEKTLRMLEMNCRRLDTNMPTLVIEDYPDFHYRGMHLDVSRNFTKKEDVMLLLDILSSYKINTFHFHLGDDEGWRLEIPGLLELTEVGARRGHTRDEQDCLYPAYGSGWDKNDPDAFGNGYYSVDDYIEILKYAAERHISIIPEFDMPGHSRAAIKSMLVRYNKYKDTDIAKAEEFLLTDLEDTSEYMSVQYYNDNAIDIARPSTYKFIFHVIDEVEKMYKAAGVPFEIWNLGGDEVAPGAWEGSNYCKLMAEELGLENIRDLEDHFVARVAEYVQSKGMKMSGWQEITIASDGKPNPALQKYQLINLCWHNGDTGKRSPGELTAAGFPIVLSNVDYFYLDMSYNAHQSEPGLYWGGYVDEFQSLSMKPWSFLPKKTDLALGVQGQLWRETLQGFDKIQRSLFPKIFGLVERAWNAETKLSVKEYNNIINVYYNYLEADGINYRVAQPGIKIIDGKLYANCVVKAADIRYTTDGSEPTQESPRWTAPVDCDAALVKAKTFYNGKESVTSWLK